MAGAEREPEHAGRGAGGRGARGAAVGTTPRPRPRPAAGHAVRGAARRRGRAVLERPVQLEGKVSPRGATPALSPRPSPRSPPSGRVCGAWGSLLRPSAVSTASARVLEQKVPGPDDARGRRACIAAGQSRLGSPLAPRPAAPVPTRIPERLGRRARGRRSVLRPLSAFPRAGRSRACVHNRAGRDGWVRGRGRRLRWTQRALVPRAMLTTSVQAETCARGGLRAWPSPGAPAPAQ